MPTTITESALMKRINRRLAHDDEALRTARPDSRAEVELGRHYVVGYPVGGVVEFHVDLEEKGRELGVLRSWERLASDA